LNSFKREFKHSLEIDVAWGEMDALGHVNNVYYLKYFESARIHYFTKMGMSINPKDAGPILAATECQYLKPITFPDRILVGAKVQNFGNTSFLMEYGVWSRTLATIAARGSARIVYFDYVKQEKIPVPDAFKEMVVKLDP